MTPPPSESGMPAPGVGGVVVAAFPAAAEAGALMLRRGGNAVDAACAAAWALAVCEPAESGLGGQGTMLLRLADGRALVLDGHSHAPALLRRARVGPRAQRRGVRATTVPSTPALLAEAQRRYGALGLADAIAPAITLAEQGYVITALQRRLQRWVIPHLRDSPEVRSLFLRPNGRAFRRGEVFRQPVLANTLRRLSRVGVRDFYEGQIADSLAADMESRGGLVSKRDLKTLGLPIERIPIEIDYRGARVLSAPPPAGGVQTLLALQMLQSHGPVPEDRVAWRVLLAKVTREVFRERERWPDHPECTDRSIERWLVSPARAASVLDRPGIAVPSDSIGESGNTTHVCAADRSGNVVSLTQSIQSVFGAKSAHPTLGFLYNNYLSTCPRTPHPYRLRGRGLPQSNASPTIVLDREGRPRMAIGSAGSRRITSSVVQVLSDVLDRRSPLQAAIAAPRAHALLRRGAWVEGSGDEATLKELAASLGGVKVFPDQHYRFGAVQAIEWADDGCARGAADPRRDGASVHVG